MRAAVLEEFGSPLKVKEVEVPGIGPYEALVRVRNCGVCGTDLKIKAGKSGPAPLPMIMGHEAAGEVVEVGSAVADFQPGDRVVVNFYITCGRCGYCRKGRDTLCEHVRQHGFNTDGGYAEYMKTPAVNLCKVPEQVSLEEACILADAVSTSYHAVTKRANIHPGMTVALIGTGGVGLHAVQMSKLAGGWTIAVDVNEDRLALAQKLGADAVVDAREGDFHQQVRRLTDGEGVDVLMEFVANDDTLESSYRSLKRGGRLVFVGYVPGLPMQIMPHEVVRNELEVVGSRANTTQELKETMSLVAQGRIRPIVDRSFPLEEVELAHELLSQGAFLGRAVLSI
jgi:propanol-preferring alcohol dehydrogenase